MPAGSLGRRSDVAQRDRNDCGPKRESAKTLWGARYVRESLVVKSGLRVFEIAGMLRPQRRHECVRIGLRDIVPEPEGTLRQSSRFRSFSRLKAAETLPAR